MKESKQANELRELTDQLEKRIQSLTDEFYQTVGECELSIDCSRRFISCIDNERIFVNSKVKITVTV